MRFRARIVAGWTGLEKPRAARTESILANAREHDLAEDATIRGSDDDEMHSLTHVSVARLEIAIAVVVAELRRRGEEHLAASIEAALRR